jgi:hypothetical protein
MRSESTFEALFGPLFEQFLQVDFSHLGARQSASAKVVMNAPGTFRGSLAHIDPLKVSESFKDHNRLLAARAGGEADTLPKGTPRRRSC